MAKHPMALKVGRTLCVLREAAGMSRTQFAERIDVRRVYYAAIERGEKKVTLRMLQRIADALGVPISDLLRQAGE